MSIPLDPVTRHPDVLSMSGTTGRATLPVLHRMNRIGVAFFYLHVPAMCAVVALAWTRPLYAALLVAIESVVVCLVVRRFFAHALGLDRLLRQRTAELDRRNAEVRVLLDHVGRGFASSSIAADDATGASARESGDYERLLIAEGEGDGDDQAEATSMSARLLRDRAGFRDFFVDAAALVERFADRETPRADALRELHTLKGNCGIFGLSKLAAACHDVETKIATDGGRIDHAHRDRLVAAWRAASERAGALFDDARDDASDVEPWRYERVELRLARAAEHARAVARSLGRASLVVHTESNDLRLPADRWIAFWASFTHVLRNAVDHGIERADERIAAGKPPQGYLGVRTFTSDDQLFVEIVDDGRGIDWKRVRERAEGAGLPTTTDADLVEAVFHDGLSTKDAASELSGRGLGLGAVRRACAELGGVMKVASTAGKGTTIHFCFPATAMTDAHGASCRPSRAPKAATTARSPDRRGTSS